MSLQRKLTISFCLFLAALFATMISMLTIYGTNEIETRGKENLEVIANQMVQQFDNLVRPMDFITINLISGGSFINTMNSLATIPRDVHSNDFFVNQAVLFINATLSNDAINRDFYSINVFNEEGDMFTSRTLIHGLGVPAERMFESFHEAFDVNSPGGKLRLVPPHTDLWAGAQGSNVFSLVRSVDWGARNIGFIEVQRLASELEQIFYVSEYMGIRTLLVSDDGRIFYTSRFDTYEQTQAFIDGYMDSEFIHHTIHSPFTGLTLHLYQDRHMLMAPLMGIVRLSSIMLLALIAFSLIFIFALHKQIIKPIKYLRGRIEALELDTLQDAMPVAVPANDLRALEETFTLMRERLSDAITVKLRAQELQMQANFDALQLQINPHFFYNVLHVISQKGGETENAEISEICASLAAMMRYSTSTLVKSATLEEELAHVKAYISLMQKRYEGRIDYNVLTDEDIGIFEMPKIVLLQFVENAINHSFRAGHKMIRVGIACKKHDDGIRIEITDDGPGFSPEALDKLNEAIEGFDNKILSQNAEFNIGGMGIRNTFVRLWHFFKGDVSFAVGSNPGEGAVVTIEIKGGQ